MCIEKGACIELGTDPEKWSKHSPLVPPLWVSREVDLFVSAVNAFLSGEKGLCIDTIKNIRSDEITSWYVEHGQMSGKHRKSLLGISPPPLTDISLRDSVRSPAKLQNQVFARDGFRCRYCGNRLISQDFLKLFIRKLDSEVFKRGNTNLTAHGIIHITWPVADHVVPWNRGGMTNLDNLIASCASCNYGKAGYTIEEIGLENPFDRKPMTDSWVGLVDKIQKLKSIEIY